MKIGDWVKVSTGIWPGPACRIVGIEPGGTARRPLYRVEQKTTGGKTVENTFAASELKPYQRLLQDDHVDQLEEGFKVGFELAKELFAALLPNETVEQDGWDSIRACEGRLRIVPQTYDLDCPDEAVERFGWVVWRLTPRSAFTVDVPDAALISTIGGGPQPSIVLAVSEFVKAVFALKVDDYVDERRKKKAKKKAKKRK